MQDIGLGVQGNGTAIFICGRTYSYGAGNADAALVCWNLNGDRIVECHMWGLNLILLMHYALLAVIFTCAEEHGVLGPVLPIYNCPSGMLTVTRVEPELGDF